MPYIRILIHLIWSTKNRKPLITKELKPLLLDHIKENSIEKGIYILAMNCVSDHIHLLISLGSEQNIAKVVMLIKGESSFWVNKNKFIPGKFEWQTEYIALSVNHSSAGALKNYIANQEEHHARSTFEQEYDKFLEESGIEKVWLKPREDGI